MDIDISKLPQDLTSLPGNGGFVLIYDMSNQPRIMRCDCQCHTDRGMGMIHIKACCSFPHDGVLSFDKNSLPCYTCTKSD